MIGKFGLWIDPFKDGSWHEPQDNWHFGLWITCPICKGDWCHSELPDCRYCKDRGVVGVVRFLYLLWTDWRWYLSETYLPKRLFIWLIIAWPINRDCAICEGKSEIDMYQGHMAPCPECDAKGRWGWLRWLVEKHIEVKTEMGDWDREYKELENDGDLPF